MSRPCKRRYDAAVDEMTTALTLLGECRDAAAHYALVYAARAFDMVAAMSDGGRADLARVESAAMFAADLRRRAAGLVRDEFVKGAEYADADATDE